MRKSSYQSIVFFVSDKPPKNWRSQSCAILKVPIIGKDVWVRVKPGKYATWEAIELEHQGDGEILLNAIPSEFTECSSMRIMKTVWKYTPDFWERSPRRFSTWLARYDNQPNGFLAKWLRVILK